MCSNKLVFEFFTISYQMMTGDTTRDYYKWCCMLQMENKEDVGHLSEIHKVLQWSLKTQEVNWRRQSSIPRHSVISIPVVILCYQKFINVRHKSYFLIAFRTLWCLLISFFSFQVLLLLRFYPLSMYHNDIEVWWYLAYTMISPIGLGRKL